MVKVAGKVWVVTGGGAGMGRELVLQVLQAGGQVAAVDVSAEGLQQTAELAEAGARLSTHVVDVTDRTSVEALVATVIDTHGCVDGLINNAGIIQPFVPVEALDYDHITRVLDVNLMGTLHMVKAFLPVFVDRPEAHIANVSSMGGFFPFPGQSVYGASKAAVKLLTEGLYAELIDTRVGVSVIMPGAVQTQITQNSGVDMPTADEPAGMPMTSAQDAARIMIEGIEKDRLYIFVGKDARLMNLAIRIAPKQAIGFIQKKMQGLLTSTAAPTG